MSRRYRTPAAYLLPLGGTTVEIREFLQPDRIAPAGIMGGPFKYPSETNVCVSRHYCTGLKMEPQLGPNYVEKYRPKVRPNNKPQFSKLDS